MLEWQSLVYRAQNNFWMVAMAWPVVLTGQANFSSAMSIFWPVKIIVWKNFPIKPKISPDMHKYVLLKSIKVLIVSIAKCLIVIGSPCVYLLSNQCAIMWVSHYRCPIWAFCNWILIIGYPCDFHINYALFNGFLCNVFLQLSKVVQTILLKRTSQKTFLIPKFVIDTIECLSVKIRQIIYFVARVENSISLIFLR